MNKVGLIAGGGSFPLIFAKEAKRRGYDVFVIGLKGITSSELEKYSAKVSYFKLGQISEPIKTLKESGVTNAVMAGNVPHVSIFSGFMPDFMAAKLLLKLKDKRAETILGTIAKAFEEEGIKIVSSATFLEHILPGKGILTKTKPSKTGLKDLGLGWRTAKTLSGLDIGLTVVVGDGAIIAVEAMEGTDACILRAGEIKKKSTAARSGLTVIKVARPLQDFRFDLPVIGSVTLESMNKPAPIFLP